MQHIDLCDISLGHSGGIGARSLLVNVTTKGTYSFSKYLNNISNEYKYKAVGKKPNDPVVEIFQGQGSFVDSLAFADLILWCNIFLSKFKIPFKGRNAPLQQSWLRKIQV